MFLGLKNDGYILATNKLLHSHGVKIRAGDKVRLARKDGRRSPP